jgi:hypothetical protein
LRLLLELLIECVRPLSDVFRGRVVAGRQGVLDFADDPVGKPINLSRIEEFAKHCW